jgi:hypothetical protein
VKQISNQLTADVQELAGHETSTPPPKPWEIAAHVQVSEAVKADKVVEVYVIGRVVGAGGGSGRVIVFWFYWDANCMPTGALRSLLI